MKMGSLHGRASVFVSKIKSMRFVYDRFEVRTERTMFLVHASNLDTKERFLWESVESVFAVMRDSSSVRARSRSCPLLDHKVHWWSRCTSAYSLISGRIKIQYPSVITVGLCSFTRWSSGYRISASSLANCTKSLLLRGWKTPSGVEKIICVAAMSTLLFDFEMYMLLKTHVYTTKSLLKNPKNTSFEYTIRITKTKWSQPQPTQVQQLNKYAWSNPETKFFLPIQLLIPLTVGYFLHTMFDSQKQKNSI